MERHQGRPLSSCDVAIVGGGLAGLSLSVQLKRDRPATSVIVFERDPHPVPEIAHKVGESTSEMGAHYLRHIGLGEHMETRQLPKPGLRFFMSADGNQDIARRPEAGALRFLAARNYQLDRGRIENHLVEEARRMGVAVVEPARAREVELSSEGHRLRVRVEGGEREVAARWIVDASGRAGFLKKRLGLGVKSAHDANAAWFRVAAKVDVSAWSDDRAWRERVPDEVRWLSTTHLMGPGYWVWLIAVGPEATSVGIVADPRLQPFEEFNTLDRALKWLERHEPQCAREVAARRDRILDFRVMRHYAYNCSRVFSAERWAITGEAGIFLDPLLSPGTDLIGLANSYITDFVRRDLDGDPTAGDLAEQASAVYTSFITDNGFRLFEGQYPIMGAPQAWMAKVFWDTVTYWGLIALIGCHDRFTEPEFMIGAVPHLYRFTELTPVMQQFFRDWADLDRGSCYEPVYVPFEKVPFFLALNDDLEAAVDDSTLAGMVARNRVLMERVARALVNLGVETVPGIPSAAAREALGEDESPADADEVARMMAPIRMPRR